MLLGQVGLIGLFLYILFFFVLWLNFKEQIPVIDFTCFVMGLSYFHPFYEMILLRSSYVLCT